MTTTAPCAIPGSRRRPQHAELITAAWHKAVESVVQTGRLLQQAKDELPHGEFQQMIDADLPFGARTAQMLMQIARHPVLSNAKFISLLPPSWATLYDLSRLPERELKELLAQGLITAESGRREVREIIRKAIDEAGGTYLAWLPSRLNTLIGYSKKWPNGETAAHRLWDLQQGQFAHNRVDIRISDLIELAQWLTDFHAACKKKQEREWAEFWPNADRTRREEEERLRKNAALRAKIKEESDQEDAYGKTIGNLQVNLGDGDGVRISRRGDDRIDDVGVIELDGHNRWWIRWRRVAGPTFPDMEAAVRAIEAGLGSDTDARLTLEREWHPNER